MTHIYYVDQTKKYDACFPPDYKGWVWYRDGYRCGCLTKEASEAVEYLVDLRTLATGGIDGLIRGRNALLGELQSGPDDRILVTMPSGRVVEILEEIPHL